MTITTMKIRMAEHLLSEAEDCRSREAVTVAGGADPGLVAGTVLGKVLTAGATVAAGGGNTGNGVFTLDATDPVLAGAAVGAYVVTITEAATDGGQYEVLSPAGASLGTANIGDTFANQIKFVIADGATDFAVGDTWTVTVAADSDGYYVRHAPAATDGSEIVAGVLFEGVIGTDVRTIHARDCQVVKAHLTYASGADAAAIAATDAALKALGIIPR